MGSLGFPAFFELESFLRSGTRVAVGFAVRILVLASDPDERQTLSRGLRHLGHEVLVQPTARGAERIDTVVAATPRSVVLLRVAGVVPKPFTPEQLGSAIEAANKEAMK